MQDTEITRKIIQVLSGVGGVNKVGNEWKKQEYVLETHDQYPKKACFQTPGANKVTQAIIQPGEELTVSLDTDSCEYQGRRFTSVNIRRVDRPMVTAPQATPIGVTPGNFAPTSTPTIPASFAPNFGPVSPIDDLPF